MPELRFDQQVVVVTDVNSGLGDACASFLASRGSSVVINELPRGTNELGSFSARSPPKTVDILVDKIRHIGGNAIATCESLANGGKIVDKAISEYGRIDILINNASFDGGENDGWDSMLDVNVKGAYKVCCYGPVPALITNRTFAVVCASCVATLQEAKIRASHQYSIAS